MHGSLPYTRADVPLDFRNLKHTFAMHHPPNNLTSAVSVVVDLPYERFDLAGWLPHFTNEEYLACTPGTKAHRQMFVYRGDDGKNVYRNDETCGGIFMTQLYREAIMERDHVLLVSPRTKGRFLERVPMSFQITWDMKVEPFGEQQSLFTCGIGSRLNLLYRMASLFICLQFWADAHCEEETPHFAESAARWATRNESERPASFVSPTRG